MFDAASVPVAALPKEREVQRAILAWLRLALPAETVIQHIANQSVARSDNYRARLKLDGQVAGWPDLAVCLPGGRVVWLEIKRPRTGRLSASQIAVHARLRAIDHAVCVATSVETAELALRALGVPLRARA